MKRILLVATAALSLVACQAAPVLPVSPAPLAQTTIDDSALQTAWKAHDALQDALNLYMDAKPSFIGTPAAHRIADINDAITAALSAAEHAASAGSSTDYLAALASAKRSLNEMKVALAALKGR